MDRNSGPVDAEKDEPVIYAGDLRSPQRILEWLQLRKDPSGNAMEEVQGPELTQMLAQADRSIVVYFCNYTFLPLFIYTLLTHY